MPLKNTIKVIYIDPPYNTNTSKSYNDKFTGSQWAVFMKDRLEACIDYLRDDGCIFISIDDNEYAQLKQICDAVFNSVNYVGTFITRQAQRSNAKHINVIHEYILCYAKNIKKLSSFSIKRMSIPDDRGMICKLHHLIRIILNEEGIDIANKKIKQLIKTYSDKYSATWLRNYTNVDEDGRIFFSVDLSTPGKPRDVNIPEIGLTIPKLQTRGWVSDERFIELHNKNLLCYKNGRPYSKHYLYDACDNVSSILNFYSRHGTEDLKRLGIQGIFDTPKPVSLIKFLIRLVTDKEDYIMDFFAGSGTTAQAVYEVNKEDKKNNKYILIQLPEPLNIKSEAYNKCLKYGIKPSMDNVLLHRINAFLKENNQTRDYNLIYE